MCDDQRQTLTLSLKEKPMWVVTLSACFWCEEAISMDSRKDPASLDCLDSYREVHQMRSRDPLKRLGKLAVYYITSTIWNYRL